MVRTERTQSKSRHASTPKSNKTKRTRSVSRSNPSPPMTPALQFVLNLEDDTCRSIVQTTNRVNRNSKEESELEEDMVRGLNLSHRRDREEEQKDSDIDLFDSDPGSTDTEDEIEEDEGDADLPAVMEEDEDQIYEIEGYTNESSRFGEENEIEVPYGAEKIKIVVRQSKLPDMVGLSYKFEISQKRKREENPQEESTPKRDKRSKTPPAKTRDRSKETAHTPPRATKEGARDTLPVDVKRMLKGARCDEDAYWTESDNIRELWVIAARGEAFMFSEDQDKAMSDVIARNHKKQQKGRDDPGEWTSRKRR